MKKLSDDEITQILDPGDQDRQSRQEQTVRTKFWPTMRRAISQLPFAQEVVTAFFVALDPQTPTHVRGILLAALAYFVMPIDFVPDFIAMFGFSDDVAVLTTALSLLKNHTTSAQKEAARKALEEFRAEDQDET